MTDESLILYAGERDTAIALIARFWQAHNRQPPDYEAADDLLRWTMKRSVRKDCWIWISQ